MVEFGLIERSDLPWVDISVAIISINPVGTVVGNFYPLTSVVLLFLMIISKLTLALSRHASLRLLHLFGFIVTRLEALSSVEVLEVRCGWRPHWVKIADRVVAERYASHSRVLRNFSQLPKKLSYKVTNRNQRRAWELPS